MKFVSVETLEVDVCDWERGLQGSLGTTGTTGDAPANCYVFGRCLIMEVRNWIVTCVRFAVNGYDPPLVIRKTVLPHGTKFGDFAG